MLEKLKRVICEVKPYDNVYILGDGVRANCLKKYIDTVLKKDCILINLENQNIESFNFDNLKINPITSCFLYEKDYESCENTREFWCRVLHIEKDFFLTKELLRPYIKKFSIKYLELDNNVMDLIQRKLEPQKPEDFFIEVNIADHCNLNCQMCTHYSPISKKSFYDLEQYKKDVSRLADLFDRKLRTFDLMGGEPLLNKDLDKYIIHTRKEFPNSEIFVHSNGILLLKSEKNESGNFWQICKDYNVKLYYTKYPINVDYDAIEQKAKEYGVPIIGFVEASDKNIEVTKVSSREPLNIHGNMPLEEFIICYRLNLCTNLRDGKIYPCPTVAYISKINERFNLNFKTSDQDYIDIYKAKSPEEICEFVSNRIPFCSYCEYTKATHGIPWQRSKRQAEEWINFE